MRVLVVAAALVLAGCTAPAAPAVATARSAAPTRTAGPSPSAESDYDKALRYTRCMTAHGETVADPVVGQPLPLGRPHQGWYSAGSPAFVACQQYLPATWPVKVDPEELVKERAFDECLRRHGIEVPQPDADGMVHYPTNLYGKESPQRTAAIEACRRYYDDPANKLPENR